LLDGENGTRLEIASFANTPRNDRSVAAAAPATLAKFAAMRHASSRVSGRLVAERIAIIIERARDQSQPAGREAVDVQ
jgi:hypothetical protein